MRTADVKIGASYAAKVSGNIVPIRITGSSERYSYRKGQLTPSLIFTAVNTVTGRSLRISAARLRWSWSESKRSFAHQTGGSR